MAEEERLTKRERRELAREERRQKAEEEAKRARKRRVMSWTVGTLVTGLIVAILVLAFTGGADTIDDVRIVDPVEATDARETAGCTELEATPSGQATHFNAAEAPPAETLYTLRPTAYGPHFETPIAPGVYAGGMDERGSTHSMEHGAIIAWYDRDRLDGDTVGQIQDWVETLNGSGFANRQAGSGLFASPFEGTFTSGKPIALRAWGAALDCDSWESVVGDAFVIANFGTHGRAPEGSFAQFPEDVLRFGPGATETATDGETDPADDGETEPADDGETEPADGGETEPAEGGQTDPADGGETASPEADASP